MKIWISSISIILLAVLFIVAGGNYYSNNKVSRATIFAMDTVMELKAYGPNGQAAVEAATEEIYRLDKLLSTGNVDSEISKLNVSGKATVSNETIEMVKTAKELWNQTKAFDIAIYPVMELWGFPSQNYKVPTEQEVSKYLSLAIPDEITIDEASNEISFEKEGMKIDLGGIAKGYASDRIMEIFDEYGVTSGMVSLGGNVKAHGKKPDGTNYHVGIQNPDNTDNYLGVVEISDDTAVITSGGYQRFFEEGGKVYHHIIDPKTGYPANSGLKSVSIISKDGTLADVLSTSIFIMGFDKGADYWEMNSDLFDMVLLDEKGDIYITEGLMETFSSDNDFIIIKK